MLHSLETEFSYLGPDLNWFQQTVTKFELAALVVHFVINFRPLFSEEGALAG